MPGKTIFLDTNGWLALLNADDLLHQSAKETWSRFGDQRYLVVTTDWIVAETGNGLARSSAKHRFGSAVKLLRTSSLTRFLFVTPALLERALEFYARRSDKTWGLVDCCSCVVMANEQVTEAFTNDRHFEQAGFKSTLPIP